MINLQLRMNNDDFNNELTEKDLVSFFRYIDIVRESSQ